MTDTTETTTNMETPEQPQLSQPEITAVPESEPNQVESVTTKPSASQETNVADKKNANEETADTPVEPKEEAAKSSIQAESVEILKQEESEVKTQETSLSVDQSTDETEVKDKVCPSESEIGPSAESAQSPVDIAIPLPATDSIEAKSAELQVDPPTEKQAIEPTTENSSAEEATSTESQPVPAVQQHTTTESTQAEAPPTEKQAIEPTTENLSAEQATSTQAEAPPTEKQAIEPTTEKAPPTDPPTEKQAIEPTTENSSAEQATTSQAEAPPTEKQAIEPTTENSSAEEATSTISQPVPAEQQHTTVESAQAEAPPTETPSLVVEETTSIKVETPSADINIAEAEASVEEKTISASTEPESQPAEPAADSIEAKAAELQADTPTETEATDPPTKSSSIEEATEPVPAEVEKPSEVGQPSMEQTPTEQESPTPQVQDTTESQRQSLEKDPEKQPPPKVAPKVAPKVVNNHISSASQEEPAHVQLYVKAHFRHANEIGDCPFSHRVMLAMKLKKVGGEVFPVNLNIRPREFEDLCATNGVACKVPILQHGETVVADTAAICDYLDKLKPEPDLRCTDRKTIAAGDKVFLKFSAFIKNRDKKQDEKLKTALIDELKKLDNFLDSKPGVYLDGDEMKHPDCGLLPKLQHVKVASKYYKKFEIPQELSHVCAYMDAAAAHPAFVGTVPSDNAIIEGWRNKIS